MRIGKLISKIRKNKNIPIRYLTRDCMSRSTYGYFIEGKTDISAHKFSILIDRLHLSWNELEYINYNTYLQKVNRLKIDLPSKNIKDLNQMKNATYEEFRNHRMLEYNKYFHLYCIINIYIEVLTGHKIQTKYKQIIKHYLSSRYSWTYYELFLFNELFFIFNATEINTFMKRIIKDLTKYNNFRPYENECARFLINIALLDIKRKRMKDENKVLTYINNMKIQNKAMLEQLSIKYLNGINKIIHHNLSGFNLIKKVFNCFKFITPNTYYPAILNNYHQTLKVYNIKNRLE